jgi:alpha-mannosidase
MEEYTEYKFLQSQPHLYRMVKEKYPDLYERIKEAVARGQFIADGGMWVEPDTNIAGGEALIRQFIHGKRYFREELGTESNLCWLPDVFGYSGAFPQIMKGCGIDYFSTQKIFWSYSGFEQFPYHTFWWEGIDGTRVLAHIHNDYNSVTRPEEIIKRWNERVQKDGISTRLYPFGWGDGGGGPERDHLEYLRRTKNLEGVPKMQMRAPVEFFKDLEKRGILDVVYVGELYFQEHRGTYTSQSKTKKGNRKCEFALREAELWGMLAGKMKGFKFDNATLDEDWKAVLLNQFHDILPGSSIQRVYEEAESSYENVLENVENIICDAVALFTEGTDALAVFNSLSWDSKKLVRLPEYFAGAIDDSGNALTIQEAKDGKYTEVIVPSCGWTTVHPVAGQGKSAENSAAVNGAAGDICKNERVLENNCLRIEFNCCGEITNIYDRENSRELAAGRCNEFSMYKDVPNEFDAWDINSMYKDTPVELDKSAQIEVVEGGPLFSSLRITKTLNSSKLTQEIILRRNSRRLDFRTRIDWQESHKLLKVNFPVNVYATEALHEIQFGYLKRPNHFSRNFDRARFEVCNHRWTALAEQNHGFAVLNDSKYGVNVFENSINLTLLKSALAPDMYADKGLQEFTYSIYVWEGSFADSNIVKEGYELNRDCISVPGDAGTASMFMLDKANIIIDTVKPAEDGSGDVIVRMYESMHMSVKCTLTTMLPLKSAVQTNMLEEYECDIASHDQNIELEFRPFEIKTVRLSV